MLATIQRMPQERSGRPTYADVARMAELTPDQLIGLSDLEDPWGSLKAEQDIVPGLSLFLSLVKLAPGAAETSVHAGNLSRETLQRITSPAIRNAREPSRSSCLTCWRSRSARSRRSKSLLSGLALCPRRGNDRGARWLPSGPHSPDLGLCQASPGRHLRTQGRSGPADVPPDDRRTRTRIEVEP